MKANPSRPLRTLNALGHAATAAYVVLFAVAAVWLGPASRFPAKATVLLVVSCAGAALGDSYAAIQQWFFRRADGLSITLHVVFATVVVVIMAFEYWQDQPTDLTRWLRELNFLPLMVLAGTRIACAAALIQRRGQSCFDRNRQSPRHQSE